MLGYTIEKTHEKLHGTAYQHLYMTIYYHDTDSFGGKWYRIGQFRWQTDNGRDGAYWYANRFEMVLERDYVEHFDQFVKFSQKLIKAGLYGQSPDVVLQWLDSLRGMVRLVYDNRLQELVNYSDAVKTADLNGYKIVRKTDGRLLDYAIGQTQNAAIHYYLTKRADHRYDLAHNVQCGIEAMENYTKLNDADPAEVYLEIIF